MRAEEFRQNISKLQNFSIDIKNKIVSDNNEFKDLPPQTNMQLVEVLSGRHYSKDLHEAPSYSGSSMVSTGKYSVKSIDIKPSSGLKKLRSSSFFVFFICLVLMIVEFIINNRALDVYKINFNLINISFQALNKMQLCMFSLRNLILSKSSINHNYQNLTKENYIKMNFDDIQIYLSELITINHKFANTTITILPEQMDLFSNNVVATQIIRGKNYKKIISNYNLLYSYNVQLSYLLNLIPQGYEEISDANPLIIVYIYNNFNEFLFNMYKSTGYYDKA